MLRVTLRSLAAHKVRLLLSAFAVVLGVAFVAGTLVFTATLRATFDDLIRQTTADVVVSPEQAFTDPAGFGSSTTGTLSQALLTKLRTVPGVSAAEGVVLVNGVTIVGRNGKPTGVPGAPNFGVNWVGSADLTPFHLIEGRGPQRSGEVSIDSESAQTGRLAVGDTVTLTTPGPVLHPRIVGIFRYGTSGNLVGASLAAFDTATAQRLLLRPGEFSSVSIKATSGVTQTELASRVRAVAPGTTVKTGAQTVDQATKQVGAALGFINVFLLVFALVALFVGTFIILNTFSMLVAQRSREIALLRAIGASRRQIAASVLAEAAVVGLLGGLAGLGLGLLLARGLQALFSAVGMDVRTISLQVPVAGMVLALGLGLGVTVLAAYLPARRAARTPPVAAMQIGASAAPRTLRLRIVVGSLALGSGLFLITEGARSANSSLRTVGAGAFAMLVSVIVLGPAIAGPVFRAVAAVLDRSVTARIAARNAGRNSRRTAATAAALMIGLALVGAFGILGSSTKASTDAVIGRVLRSDFIVAPTGILPFSPRVAAEIRQVPGIGVVSEVKNAPARISGQIVALTGIDPATITRVLQLKVLRGTVADLGTDGLIVDDKLASSKGYHIGQVVTVTLLTGKRTLHIVAEYASATGFSGYVVAGALLVQAGMPNLDYGVYVQAAPGVRATSLRPALDRVVAAYPTVRLRDQSQYKQDLRSQVDQLLSLIYALLGLAVLIAILGIVNTLALSVVERTREIGLLRAIGVTRRQLRRLIRIESVLIALFGAALGITLGLVFGIALQHALAGQGVDALSIPWSLLVVVTAVAALVGVLAAVWPARRAGRLDVLTAIGPQ